MVCKGADSIRALKALQLKPQYKYTSNLYVETWQLCCVASPFCTAGYAGKQLTILQTGPSTTVSVLLLSHEKWAWKKEGRQRMTHYRLKWMKGERVAGRQESGNMIQKDAQRNRERLRAAVTALLSVPWWLCSGWRLTRCIMQHHPHPASVFLLHTRTFTHHCHSRWTPSVDWKKKNASCIMARMHITSSLSLCDGGSTGQTFLLSWKPLFPRTREINWKRNKFPFARV